MRSIFNTMAVVRARSIFISVPGVNDEALTLASSQM